MNSIIDPTPEVTGNPEKALDILATTTVTPDSKEAPAEKRYMIPEKFVGKSLEEVLTTYQNLEAAYGRATAELGQSRQSVDQLLSQKRENDLRANGATQVTQRQPTAPTKLTAADLLENPQEALDSYLEKRESSSTQELRQRLANQEIQMAQTQFVSRHPDWQTMTNDPNFVNWARQTPYRQNLAARAAREDLAAADALLSEFKAYQPLLTRSTAQSATLDAARKVGLERTAAVGDTTAKPTGKILRRADSMALRISNPDKYESQEYQNELLKAIAEDRYK